MSILMHGSEKALVLKEKFMAEVSDSSMAFTPTSFTSIVAINQPKHHKLLGPSGALSGHR